MKKKIIRETIYRSIEFDRPVDDLIRFLKALKEDYPDYSNFSIDEEWVLGESSIFNISAERSETDKELEKRKRSLAKTKKVAASVRAEKESKERREYARLEKKYGGM